MPTDLGIIATDSKPVLIVSSTQQVCFASAGILYVFDLASNVLSSPISFIYGPVSMVGYSDGFFLALLANSRQFFVSAINDATNWPGIQNVIVTLFPDNIICMTIDHREVWLQGATKTTVYYNAGAPIVPFVPDQSAYIEMGAASQTCTSRLDNSLFSLGADDRGWGMAWRAQGYNWVRVSNHAIETAWSKYDTLNDAVSYSYQEEGHIFWVIYFPTANATWVYDVSVQQWHRRGLWNGSTFTADRTQNHVFAFGKHLVGDPFSGNLFESSIYLYDDAGNLIRRIRRTPWVGQEKEWVLHHNVELDVETGLEAQPPLLDGQGNPRAAMATLRWSNDYGHKWSNEYDRSCGLPGEYSKRVRWLRLGKARGRVYELSVSDPVPWRIVSAYTRVAPQEREAQ